MVKDLNVQPDAIKLLEENLGRTHFDINCSNISLNLPPRVMKIKIKINKWELIKLKIFCTAKWEKIFAKKRKYLQNERKGNLPTLLVGMHIGTATMENIMEVT